MERLNESRIGAVITEAFAVMLGDSPTALRNGLRS